MSSALLALASAFLNALNVVTQHVASTAAPTKAKGFKLALYLIRNPLWIFGLGTVLAAFVCQALALYRGLLSVVQSILVTELVFSLLIARQWLKRDVTARAWISASVTSVGLAVFLLMSEPQGGHSMATASAWLPASLSLGGLTALLTILAGTGSPRRRAALYACAAGLVWAILAVFLKSASNVLGTSGFLAMMEQGAVYGVIVSGIIGTIISQAALHYGPLAISQPLMVIVNPFVSIILSIWLYGEHFTGGPFKMTIAAAGFLVMSVGVVFLARTGPSFAAPAAIPTSSDNS